MLTVSHQITMIILLGISLCWAAFCSMKVCGRWETPHFTAGTERKLRFLPEQLPHVGREPPTRLTRTHSKNKQNVLKKQPLLEMATFISKPTLPWIYISSDYSIPRWWSLLPWPGSKGSLVPSSSEPETVNKSSGYQDAKQILKKKKKKKPGKSPDY